MPAPSFKIGMAGLPTSAKPSLESALRNAAILGWDELMSTASAGVINIEYHTGPGRLLEYLKVWASVKRGYWSLICEYWKCSLWSHMPGLSFAGTYGPGNFSLMLENVMQHEDDFEMPPKQDGSVQVYAPTKMRAQKLKLGEGLWFND